MAGEKFTPYTCVMFGVVHQFQHYVCFTDHLRSLISYLSCQVEHHYTVEYQYNEILGTSEINLL